MRFPWVTRVRRRRCWLCRTWAWNQQLGGGCRWIFLFFNLHYQQEWYIWFWYPFGVCWRTTLACRLWPLSLTRSFRGCRPANPSASAAEVQSPKYKVLSYQYILSFNWSQFTISPWWTLPLLHDFLLLPLLLQPDRQVLILSFQHF